MLHFLVQNIDIQVTFNDVFFIVEKNKAELFLKILLKFDYFRI